LTSVFEMPRTTYTIRITENLSFNGTGKPPSAWARLWMQFFLQWRFELK
jgi:hypothetical protein